MSETPDMVDRVARSVCIALGYEPEEWACSEPVRERCRSVARSAIEAMREMTDAMAAAAWESKMADVQGQWSDVIDAALTQPASTA